MCGRTRLYKTVDDVRRQVGVDEAHSKEAADCQYIAMFLFTLLRLLLVDLLLPCLLCELVNPSSNHCPGRGCPVVYVDSKTGQKLMKVMRWGLVPSFHPKGQKFDFFRMFNARWIEI